MPEVNELAIGEAAPAHSDAKEPTWRKRINIAAVATALALGGHIGRNVIPWWSSVPALAIALAAYGSALRLLKDTYADKLKNWQRAALASAITTALATIVLAAEIALIAIVPLLPPPIRVLPGPQLHLALGAPHQQLDLSIEGRRYVLDDPPRGPFYLRTWRVHLAWLLKNEDAKALAGSIAEVYRAAADETELAEALRKKWADSEPAVMKRAENDGSASALIDNGQRRPLVVRKLQTQSKGMASYVAELPPRH